MAEGYHCAHQFEPQHNWIYRRFQGCGWLFTEPGHIFLKVDLEELKLYSYVFVLVVVAYSKQNPLTTSIQRDRYFTRDFLLSSVCLANLVNCGWRPHYSGGLSLQLGVCDFLLTWKENLDNSHIEFSS